MAIVFPGGTQSGPALDEVIQVVTYTNSSTHQLSGHNYSFHTLNITPTSSSNYIIIMGHCNIGGFSTTGGLQIRRGSSLVSTLVGNQWGSNRQRMTGVIGNGNNAWQSCLGFSCLDNPNTTSQVGYNFRFGIHGAGTFYLGRSSNNTDDQNMDNATSLALTVRLLEVKP